MENSKITSQLRPKHIILIVIIVIGVFASFYWFACIIDASQVTFGVEIEIGKSIIKLHPSITKICASRFELSTVPPNDVKELISQKVNLLRVNHSIMTLQEAIIKLENEIKYISGYPENERSQWQQEELPKMQQKLEEYKTTLQLEQQKLPKLIDDFKKKTNDIKIKATENELKEIATQVNAINFYPLLELDQKIYTWTDKVYLTIIDPMANRDVHQLDTVGGRNDRILKVETSRGTADIVVFLETGVDTGIFTTEIILTGFAPYDIDGDGSLMDVSGVTSHYIGPGGDGKISAAPNDILRITYEFLENEKVSTTAKIEWNIGQATWLEAGYPVNEIGVVRVIDPDINLNPEIVDKISILVSSSSDPTGFVIYLNETNEATGIFEGSVLLTSKKEPTTNGLFVKIGDNVTASYIDRTLPKPYIFGDSLEVTANSIVK